LKEVGLYGGSYESLTASEARQLMEAGSLDEARNRIFEARQKGNNAIRAEILSRARSEEDSEINAEGRSERDGPVDGHVDAEVRKFLNDLPFGVVANDGASLAEAAELAGYPAGEALLEDLKKTKAIARNTPNPILTKCDGLNFETW
jgi:hypothetical protein